MKNIYNYSHVKSVSVSILVDDTNAIQGKIISNFSDNPNGSVCTSQIIFYQNYDNLKPKNDPIKIMDNWIDSPMPLIGKAGGYGYDKLSSSISSAIHNNCEIYPKTNFGGVGDTATAKYFKDNFNLTLISILR